MSKKEIFEKENDVLAIDVPKEKRKLNTASYDYAVQSIVELMHTGRIILEVPFQRNFIWKDDRASQLIESIILNVPIPPLYFAEEKNGNWIVIDGLQRLNSLRKFYSNNLNLKSLEIIKELEGINYSKLPPKSKNLLDAGLLRVNIIKNDSHPDIKYDIFMRLNKGSVTLNYQELRNCLYRGEFNNMMKNIVAKNKKLLKILKLKKPHDRFLDVEFVLRYFALSDNLVYNSGKYHIKNYKGRMVQYLNDYMNKNKDIKKTIAKKKEIEFNNLVDKVIAVFGTEKAFRDITSKSTKMYKAIADFILISFDKFSISELKENRIVIIKLLKRLLNNNITFKKAISQRTSDADILNYRINYWLKAIKNAI